LLSVTVLLALVLPAAAAATGATFTTNAGCTGVNINLFESREAVYLDGGPRVPSGSGLEDGVYYVKVTAPDGTLLGTSIASANETPVTVVGGEFVQCYQLWSILIKASDGTTGYDLTPNAGGEYKVWVSKVADFHPSSTKTDNFKVIAGTQPATLNVIKFYDANANGINDDNMPIIDWKVQIQDGIDYIRYTPVSIQVAPDDYTVTEFMPIETNWRATTPNPVYVTVAAGDNKTVEFGNLCLGAGGGLTKGFWTNKNGAKLVGADDLAMLRALNLRNADGSAFDPTSFNQLKAWLKDSNAVNMAYMLSAQLAAMELNVFNDKVNGGALIYAPGVTSANSLGYATVDAVMAEANAELGLHGVATADTPELKAYQEALKNALDNANNNTNFVQATACPFTFAE